MILHESFCARPDKVMRESAIFTGIPGEQVPYWKEVVPFFKEGFHRRDTPFLEENQLWERVPTGGKRRIGGAKYNPVPLSSLNRTIGDPVASWMNTERLNISCEIFGDELTDLWMNDSEESYLHSDAETVAAMKRAAR